MPENEFPKLKPHPFRNATGLPDGVPSLSGPALAPAPAPAPDPALSSPACFPYAELCTTSNYTFLTGASHPEEFIQHAATLGYRAIAITDTNTLAGVVRAHAAAKDIASSRGGGRATRFILGSRLTFQDAPGLSLCLYPTDMPAYRRLCRLLTTGKRRAPKGQCHLTLADLAAHNEGLLAIAVFMSNPNHNRNPNPNLPSFLSHLKSLFDHDRLSLALTLPYAPDDAARLSHLSQLAHDLSIPLVATTNAHAHHPDRRMFQAALTCIRHGRALSSAGFRLHPNAERHLKSPEELHRLFAAHPRALARTLEIAERTAGFSLDQLRYEYPDEVVPQGTTPMRHLTDLTWRGAADRYPAGIPDKVRRIILHELQLIDELNYAPYFLTVHDLVRYARSGRETPDAEPPPGWAPILCQGRGAAANSAVCYCIGVTAVDPARIDLLFERFISKERNEPPDIDIDFEHERREEVIQYIYRKYGRDRAALTAEVISYRRRSATRDVGKALGLSLDLVDRLAKDSDWWEQGAIEPTRMREMGLNPEDPTLQWLARLTGEILGFPRHLSQHVGGFVITRTPLCELVPVENAAMPDRTVIEWDKDDIDAVGMLKVDCLGLGMLSCIRRAFDFINESGKVSRCRGVEVSRKTPALQETSHESDSLVQGPHRLAEGQEPRQTHLQGNGEDAQVGDVRPDLADASRGRLDSLEHRRGIQPQDPPGIHPRPSHRQRIPGRTGHPVGDRGGTRVHACRPDDRGTHGRDRQNALRTHPQTRTEVTAPALSTPRHLDTSTPLQLHTVPPEDPTVYDAICKADTVGVFQIESRAQMSMLPRLRPRNFYDLVIEVAIVRPGPIQGKMVHPYLRRRNGEEQYSYPNSEVEKVLAKTLGVPLFQEQAMALAMVAGGFTPGQADQLRRAMAAWKRKGDLIFRLGEKLVAGMLARGYTQEFADRCFEQIKGFSEYGFPESHAASFALLVYVSAWQKVHHPAAFAAALINSQPMGFYAPAQIVRDAQEHGVEVRPIDVNISEWDCTLEEGVEVSRCPGVQSSSSTPRHLDTSTPALRLGLRLIDGLRRADADLLVSARRARGPSQSIERLWRTGNVPVRALRRLAAADAFGSMNLSRQDALWHIRRMRDEHLPLFDTIAATGDDEPIPHLPAIPAARTLRHDYDAIGLSLKGHPLALERDRLAALGILTALQLRDPALCPHGKKVAVAGLVLVRQRPATAAGIVFMTIEDESAAANLILFPKVFHKYRRAARHSVAVAAWGTVERAGEVVHVKVRAIADLHDAADFTTLHRPVSRDFR